MEAPNSAVDRREMRVGSAALLVGGVGAFTANLFHPHDFPSQTEPLLRFVAAIHYWSRLHFLIMTSVALLVCGYAILTRNLADPRARALGTLGRYLVILGGAVYMVEVMVDGFGMSYFANQWAAATDPVQKAVLLSSGDAVIRVWGSLFPVFSGVFCGLATTVIGASVTISGNFPRWLGLWGAVSGVLCLVTGFGAGLRIHTPLLVWIVGISLLATWGPPLGIMMWRASSHVTRR
jgi:hypothetical protein